jgi:hypothetical protein
MLPRSSSPAIENDSVSVDFLTSATPEDGTDTAHHHTDDGFRRAGGLSASANAVSDTGFL